MNCLLLSIIGLLGAKSLASRSANPSYRKRDHLLLLTNQEVAMVELTWIIFDIAKRKSGSMLPLHLATVEIGNQRSGDRLRRGARWMIWISLVRRLMH